MNNTVNIRLLDKEYQVNCPPEEQAELIRSSQLLDARMNEIRKSGHVIGLERIAVMAALNLSYDLLQTEKKLANFSVADKELSELDSRLTDILDNLKA